MNYAHTCTIRAQVVGKIEYVGKPYAYEAGSDSFYVDLSPTITYNGGNCQW